MINRKKTIPVRMRRGLHSELKVNFPEVRMSDLLDIMYKTSALRLENALRKKPKKK